MSKLNIYHTASVVTGKLDFHKVPSAEAPQGVQGRKTERASASFGSLFSQALQDRDRSNSVSFSKHAAARMQERSIQLNSAGLERLNKGVELARNKGLNDALILMDRNAFVVSAQNKTVITAVNGKELNGNVFTNIDGAVVI